MHNNVLAIAFLRFFSILMSIDSLSKKTFFSSSHATIERHQFLHGKMMSCFPSSWMSKAVKPLRNLSDRTIITDIVYLPSFFDREGFAALQPITDDDHFLSQLADTGFIVHCLSPITSKDSVLLCDEAIRWIVHERKQLTARNLAIIADELACMHLLHYLRKYALPLSIPTSTNTLSTTMMSFTRMDIGAIICIDPAPITAWYTRKGRKLLLQR
jgi:hypothetical protein